MSTCGIVTVVLQKRLRALQSLRTFLAGRLTLSALQKLNGLLEHFVHIFALGRDMMADMYLQSDQPEMDSGILRQPSKLVPPSKSQQSIAGRWIRFITTVAGCSAASYTAEKQPLHFSSHMLSWHPDAANEDLGLTADGLGVGLGAYAAGYWWNWPLTPEARLLPVPVLELIALAACFLVFGPLYRGMIHEQCKLLIHCDSLASVLAVAFQRTKSRLMLVVLKKLRLMPHFQSIAPHTAVTHTKGVGNVMGDAASRGHRATIDQFTSQIGVKSIQLQLPRPALDFIHEMVAYCRTLSDVELDISITQRMNADSASNPQMRDLPAPPRRLPPTQQLREPEHRQECQPKRPRPAGCALPAPPAQPTTTVNRAAPVSGPICVAPPAAAPNVSALRLQRRKELDDAAVTAAGHMAQHTPLPMLSAVSTSAPVDFVVEMFRSVLRSIPDGTMKIDERDWQHWSEFCRSFGYAPLRLDLRAHLGHDASSYWTEIMLQAMAFFHQLRLIMPRSSRTGLSGRPVPAKPTSVTVVTTVRRVHGYFGVNMAQSTVYKSVLRAALNTFVNDNGISALLPERKEPFTNAELIRMVTVPQGSVLRNVIVSQTNRLWRSIEMLAQSLAQTGLRLADALQVNRAAVHYEVAGVKLNQATQELLARMDNSSTVFFKIGSTKSDPLGRHFATFPAYLPFSATQPVNAARSLALYDIDFPVPLADRSTEPLFTDGNGRRLQRSQLERVLTAWLKAVGVDSSTHSWHSFRITLAVCLKAAGADDSIIKSMVRWVSDASLKLYARDSRKLYADWLGKALTADASTVQACNLCDLDDDAYLHELQRVLGRD